MGQPTKAAGVITGVALLLGMACAERPADSGIVDSTVTNPVPRTFYVKLVDSATGNPMPRAGIVVTCTDDAGRPIECDFSSAMPADPAAATVDSGVGNPVP